MNNAILMTHTSFCIHPSLTRFDLRLSWYFPCLCQILVVSSELALIYKSYFPYTPMWGQWINIKHGCAMRNEVSSLQTRSWVCILRQSANPRSACQPIFLHCMPGKSYIAYSRVFPTGFVSSGLYVPDSESTTERPEVSNYYLSPRRWVKGT